MTALIQSLQNPQIYHHPTESIDVIETHISWVILTGEFAYKIKKPVKYEFLDFSTLDKRHHYCQQELQLNRRLAENLYLDVVAIYGSADKPSFSDTGPVIEYAVKMRQFPQDCQLDKMLQRDVLTIQHIESLANIIADFHNNTISADKQSPYGEPSYIHQTTINNIVDINAFLDKACNTKSSRTKISTVSRWSESEFENIRDLLRQRKEQGFIKECHGDMHLRNIVFIDNAIIAFDCLEFNQQLRWIDVISEVAFVVMDLQYRNQKTYANLLLNRYLSLTGDYAGLRVFRYYLVYRAMVRAKVAYLSACQSEISPYIKAQALQEFNDYLFLANEYTKFVEPSLYITHGLSGSGKSRLAKKLTLDLPVICLQSDVERKRKYGISQLNKSDSGLNEGIYNPFSTEQIYKLLCSLTEAILLSGWSVTVDATFLQRRHRELFSNLAAELNINFVIFDCVAEIGSLHKRLIKREKHAGAVSEANILILNAQIISQQPLEEDEIVRVIRLDSDSDISISDSLKNKLKGVDEYALV